MSKKNANAVENGTDEVVTDIQVSVAVSTTSPQTSAVMPGPRLGDTIKVVPAQGLMVRMNQDEFYPSDEPTEVSATTRIIKLLRDGDLIRV